MTKARIIFRFLGWGVEDVAPSGFMNVTAKGFDV